MSSQQRKELGILYDLSEFVSNPVRSGIQRVAFEICSRWSGLLTLIPMRIDERGRPRILPSDFIQLMIDFFRSGRNAERQNRDKIFSASGRAGEPLSPEEIFSYACVFNAELFYSMPRIKFYQWMLSHRRLPVFFVIYDFLPWLYPDEFPDGAITGTMPYLKLIRELELVSFISDSTRRDYLRRILRNDKQVGPVLRLGSDGLGVGEPLFSSRHKNFTVLGTLEPRKNHLLVVDAFQILWEKGVDVELTFVGRLGWMAGDDQDRIRQLEQEQPRFKWFKELRDDGVREVIRNSRATIYPSTVEGFGLPPLESLALGVPVIVTELLPSIEMIESYGQIRLSSVTPKSICDAVQIMLDHDQARAKYEEIRNLRLPKWTDLASDAETWIQSHITSQS